MTTLKLEPAFSKILWLTIILFGYSAVFAQQKLPVLKSDSNTITIKIDGQHVGNWQVDSDTKPGTDFDVFRMDRSFNAKRVSYISNRDSISFTVIPGEKYDFFILLQGKSFPTEITMAEEPVFLHTNMVILVLASLILIALITYVNRKSLPLKPLLYCGILAPLFFWIVTITGGFIHGGYNHLHNVVSELGAIGTRSETFMSSVEMLDGVLGVFSVIGFYRACRQTGVSIIPVLGILSLPVSMFWAATFPMHHEYHGLLGPIPLLVNLSALLAVFIWRKKDFFPIRIISGVSFIIMTLLLFRIIPDFRAHYEGLAQRFFYTGWSVWSVSLSVFFIKQIAKKNNHRI